MTTISKLTISARMYEIKLEIAEMRAHGSGDNGRPVGKRPIPLPEGRHDLMPRNYLRR